MIIGAHLPKYLWPEVIKAAVYLLNRTPRWWTNWKPPFERFHTHISYKRGVVREDCSPWIGHLRAYGCKAYAMTVNAKNHVVRYKQAQKYIRQN